MASKTMEVKESSRCAGRRGNGRTRTERLWESEIYRDRITAERRGAAKNSCLLASMQLPGARHDLSSGQSSAERAAQAGAHQEPAARTLGSEPGLAFVYIHLNRVIKKYRPRHDLHGRSRSRRAWCSGSGLSRGHVLRDLSRQERGRRRSARVLQAVLVSRAASAVTARPKRPARFTKAANWATCFRTPAARRSTIRT